MRPSALFVFPNLFLHFSHSRCCCFRLCRLERTFVPPSCSNVRVRTAHNLFIHNSEDDGITNGQCVRNAICTRASAACCLGNYRQPKIPSSFSCTFLFFSFLSVRRIHFGVKRTRTLSIAYTDTF